MKWSVRSRASGVIFTLDTIRLSHVVFVTGAFGSAKCRAGAVDPTSSMCTSRPSMGFRAVLSRGWAARKAMIYARGMHTAT